MPDTNAVRGADDATLKYILDKMPQGELTSLMKALGCEVLDGSEPLDMSEYEPLTKAAAFDLLKARKLDPSKLVEKQVVVHGKNGTFMRRQLVDPNDMKSSEKGQGQQGEGDDSGEDEDWKSEVKSITQQIGKRVKYLVSKIFGKEGDLKDEDNPYKDSGYADGFSWKSGRRIIDVLGDIGKDVYNALNVLSYGIDKTIGERVKKAKKTMGKMSAKNLSKFMDDIGKAMGTEQEKIEGAKTKDQMGEALNKLDELAKTAAEAAKMLREILKNEQKSA